MGSSPISATRPVGQEVKTPPFHGSNMGSIPVRVTKKETSELCSDVSFYPSRQAWYGIRRKATAWNHVEDVNGITRQRVSPSA